MKAYLKQLAKNSTHLNSEERTLLLRILVEFEELFEGTLGDWATEPTELELNPDSKPFNSR